MSRDLTSNFIVTLKMEVNCRSANPISTRSAMPLNFKDIIQKQLLHEFSFIRAAVFVI